MRRFTRTTLSCALLVVAVAARAEPPLPTAEPQSLGFSSERLDLVTKWFKREVDEGKLPGVVIAVARRGKLAYFESFGDRDREAKQPMATDTIFRIYSMTKPLVSVAAVMLMEEGKLQLTDPVSKFLPEFKDQQVSVPKADGSGYELVKAERAMTVHDLLRHTSGLAYGELTRNPLVKEAYAKAGMYKTTIDFDAREMTPEEQAAAIGKAPLAQQPGRVWEYSHSSDILGRVVEKASGMRLGDFLEQRIFRPLRMKDTAFHVPQPKSARLAAPLPKDPLSGNVNKMIDVAVQPKNDSGGAGAVSTAADYVRFSQMLLNGGTLDGARILSRTSVRLMTSDHLGDRIKAPLAPGELLIGTQGYTFGLGFAVRTGPGLAGVPGSTGEFMWAGYGGTYFWIDPEEEIVGVFMSQAPSPQRAFYRRQLKQLVYQAIAD
jgi:CubicO group peptidase (beta-lactamase class C family)